MVTLISDGALCSNFIHEQLRKLGITALIIAPDSSRLNLVERSNRTIAEGGRALNDTAGLPPTTFLLACVHMVNIQNRIFKQTTLQAPDGRPLSPIELYEKRNRASVEDLFKDIRVFGSLAFALQHTDKQVTKSERCINLGLAFDNPKNTLLMSLEKKRFFTSRNTISDEVCFPFKKSFEFPREITTRHDQGDAGETIEEAIECLQPTAKSLPLYDIPQVDKPLLAEEQEQEGPDLTEEMESLSISQPLGDQNNMEADKHEGEASAEASQKNAPQTPHMATRRLSFGQTNDTPAPIIRDLFDEHQTPLATIEEDPGRTALGTGDNINDVDPRSSPAKFQVGALYDTIYDEPAQIISNNLDGDVQVVFPENKSPTKQWTIDKSKIFDLVARDGEALVSDTLTPGLSSKPDILRNPLDWIPMTYDGLLVPSCDFALAAEEDFTRRDPLHARNLAQAHGGFSHKQQFHVAFLSVDDLVGKVLADDVDIPKYHFGVKHHPLRAICEEAMDFEFNTLVRKGVFGKGRERCAGDIGSMFVLKAKSDAEGLLAKVKARLTVLGNQEKKELLSYSPVMLLTTIRMMISLHCADLEVLLPCAGHHRRIRICKGNSRNMGHTTCWVCAPRRQARLVLPAKLQPLRHHRRCVSLLFGLLQLA